MMRSVLALAILLVFGGPVRGQDIPTKNPLEGDPEAIRAGQGLFRARCADCHGVDARGIRSPDLTQVWASGRTDDGLFRTLRNGIPGTEMRAVGARTPDDEVWKILAYLRTLAAPVPSEPPLGNAEHGQQVFRVNCASCHRVDGTGGRLGPDLSRIGLARSRQTLVRQIRGAMEDFRPGYAPVTITLPDGRVLRGVKKNEDLFSVQIMDTRERIQGYVRDDVRQVANETKSAMPVFGPERLSEADLNDLLAYLQGLRGFDPSVK
jgi:putative heme-binding domain-containing protein